MLARNLCFSKGEKGTTVLTPERRLSPRASSGVREPGKLYWGGAAFPGSQPSPPVLPEGLSTHLGGIADAEKDHVSWGAFGGYVPGSRYCYYSPLKDYETET